jgi:hypothetical protein
MIRSAALDFIVLLDEEHEHVARRLRRRSPCPWLTSVPEFSVLRSVLECENGRFVVVDQTTRLSRRDLSLAEMVTSRPSSNASSMIVMGNVALVCPRGLLLQPHVAWQESLK